MWNKQAIKRIILRVYSDLRLQVAAVGVFVFVWWGILYPELCFTDNTYKQVIIVDGEEIEGTQSDYRDVLGASGEQIVIKSRLLEWIEQKIKKE